MKTLIIVIISVVATLTVTAGVGMFVVGRARKAEAGDKVRVESPERSDLVEIVSAPGRIEPKTKVSISANVSARIVELPHDEGSRVTKGDPEADPPVPPSVLVRLDATDLLANLRAAEARKDAQAAELKVIQAGIAGQQADIEGLLASLTDARRTLARHEQLRQSGDVALSDYERSKCQVDELTASHKSAQYGKTSRELQLEVLQCQLAVAEAEIARAKDMLSQTTITSPTDGVVTRINADVGELAMTGTMNNPGTVIVEVADLSTILAVAEVDESDVGALEVGQRATVQIRAYPDSEFGGVVESIALTSAPAAGGGSGEFLVKILLDDPGRRIYSGLSAEVEIETQRHVDVLRVPSQAILGRPVDQLPPDIRDDNPQVNTRKTFATVVYRLIDGKSVVTPVVVGPSDTTHTIVRSGLTEADRVVTGPYKVLEALQHGQRIQDDRAQGSDESSTQPASEPSSASGAVGVMR